MRSSPIVVFTEKAEWHTGGLRRRLERRGFEVLVRSLNDCGFAIGETAHGVLIPGLDDRLPAAVFVRLIAAGSLEQITARLGLLHALRELGVPVFNDARVIERCVDKSMTSFLVAKAGIPTPRTFVLERRGEAQAIVDQAPGDSVLKPLFGSQGKGIRRIAPRAELPEPAAVNGVYYLQDLIESRPTGEPRSWHDWRVFVVGDTPVAAMIRRSTRWITNIHQGAEGEAAPVDGEAGRLAVAAAKAIGASYAGVDLIEDREGRFLVLEVNSMPAWKGLQKATGIDIADQLAAMVARRLEAAWVG